MKKRQPLKSTNLRCVECGTKQEIFRNTGWQKKEGHIKTLYCFKCKGKTLHEEKKVDVFEF